MSERVTASFDGPEKMQRPAHSRHHFSVSAMVFSKSRKFGSSRCDAYQQISNGIFSRADTVNLDVVWKFSPQSSTGVRKRRVSGPAMAVMPSFDLRTQGTIDP